MFEIDQFYPDEAWIFFKLNSVSVPTEQDGNFDVFCVMEASSQIIFATEFISVGSAEPSILESKRMYKQALSQTKTHPKTLIVSIEQESQNFINEALKNKVSIVTAPESALMIFIKEARDGFYNHVIRGQR